MYASSYILLFGRSVVSDGLINVYTIEFTQKNLDNSLSTLIDYGGANKLSSARTKGIIGHRHNSINTKVGKEVKRIIAVPALARLLVHVGSRLYQYDLGTVRYIFYCLIFTCYLLFVYLFA